MAINIHSVLMAIANAVKKSKSYTDQKTSGIAGGVKYKGAVSYYSDLPNNAEEGDAYTVKYSGTSGTTPDGTEYVWGYDSDLQALTWIDFSKDSYTKAQTDAIINPINEQVELNKNNISSNWGAKNLLVNRGSLRKISPYDDITYTWVNGDVSVTGHKASEGTTSVDVIPVTPLSDLGLSDKVVISNNGTKCYLAVIFWSETLGPSSIYEIVSGSNIIDIPSGYTHIMARLGVKSGVVGSINETIQPMICTKAQWDISHEYQPYPFSNAELTAAERQNESNISKLETKVNTNAGIISQTYNSTDCNISLILRQDSTEDLYVHYDTEARKLYMPYKVIKNQYKYWKDGVAYYKYHVLTEGVIMTNNSAKCNMLTTDTPEIANETYKRSWVATDDGGSAVTTTFNLSKANSEIGDVWYNRPYVIYDDLETGMRYKMYGPVYKITAGTPCTIECDTLSCTELTAAIRAIQALLANQ